jgi:hypothetical protein
MDDVNIELTLTVESEEISVIPASIAMGKEKVNIPPKTHEIEITIDGHSDLTITPPEGVELSPDGEEWTTQLIVVDAEDEAITVLARAITTETRTISGNITITSNTDSANVAVSGTVAESGLPAKSLREKAINRILSQYEE